MVLDGSIVVLLMVSVIEGEGSIIVLLMVSGLGGIHCSVVDGEWSWRDPLWC